MPRDRSALALRLLGGWGKANVDTIAPIVKTDTAKESQLEYLSDLMWGSKEFIMTTQHNDDAFCSASALSECTCVPVRRSLTEEPKKWPLRKSVYISYQGVESSVMTFFFNGHKRTKMTMTHAARQNDTYHLGYPVDGKKRLHHC